jgi:hypothetical protein
MGYLQRAIILIAGITAGASPCAAKVVKFNILRVESPAFEGRTFGSIGTYDRIVARATIAVDPANSHNTIIADIERAPRNAQGAVEAVADVEILRPTVAANGNRRLFYEVLNRGSKLGFALFNDLPVVINDLVKATDAGNGFLMNRGYTLVWSGWQGDIVPGGGRMGLSPPVVPGITGLAREDFIFDHNDNPAIAALTYPAADLDPAHAKISVREREADARATPPGLEFKFEGPSKISISRPPGFDAGAIYEFIYTAKDPKVMGLGFAATRDIVSFLRNETADAAGTANPLTGQVDRAIGFGLSQSGRYIHDYLYLGFNADETGRQVFDGLMPHISGAKKTFTNYRFSQPGRSPYEHADMLYPGADFPFTYPVITDALTGKKDGFLARCLARHARKRPTVPAVEPATLLARQRQVRTGQNLRLSNQSAQRRTARAGLAGGAGYVDQQRYGAAGQPVSEPRRCDADTSFDRSGWISEHPRHRLSHADRTTDRAQIGRNAAFQGSGISGFRPEDRRRRPRPRRGAAAHAGGAGGYPYRLEPSQIRFWRGRVVRQQRHDDPLRCDPRGTTEERRSALVIGGALSTQRRSCRGDSESSAATGARSAPAGR